MRKSAARGHRLNIAKSETKRATGSECHLYPRRTWNRSINSVSRPCQYKVTRAGCWGQSEQAALPAAAVATIRVSLSNCSCAVRGISGKQYIQRRTTKASTKLSPRRSKTASAACSPSAISSLVAPLILSLSLLVISAIQPSCAPGCKPCTPDGEAVSDFIALSQTLLRCLRLNWQNTVSKENGRAVEMASHFSRTRKCLQNFGV